MAFRFDMLQALTDDLNFIVQAQVSVTSIDLKSNVAYVEITCEQQSVVSMAEYSLKQWNATNIQVNNSVVTANLPLEFVVSKAKG